MHAFVGREDSEEVLSFVGSHRDPRGGGGVLVLDSISIVLSVTGVFLGSVVSRSCCGFYFEKVEEWVCRVGIVSTERLKAELSVHEDDSVACFKKVFSGCGTART